MAIADEIIRLNTAKADIKEAIEGFGVSVPSTDKIDTYAEKIGQISGGDWLPSAETVLATFARRQSGGEGPATIEKIYGKTVVRNQLVKDYTDAANLIASGSSSISYTGGKIEINTASSSSNDAVGIKMKGITPGHVYAILTDTTGTVPVNYKLGSAIGVGTSGITLRGFSQKILTTSASWQVPQEDGAIWFFGTQTSFSISYLHIIDLTLMYGEGNEPSTVEEFLTMHPEALSAPYDAGSLLPVKAEKIVTRGFNQWDEVYDFNGVNSTNGAVGPWSDRICSTNFIKVTPGVTLYLKSSQTMYVIYYDANKEFISSTSVGNGTFTPPANCYFIKWSARNNSYGMTYLHDTCINISDSSKNGTYEPYRYAKVGLPILKHFPTGLRGVGDSYDEIGPKKKVQRRGVVDLGDLTYGMTSGAFFATVSGRALGKLSLKCPLFTAVDSTVSNLADGQMMGATDSARVYFKNSAYADATEFKSAMSGVMLDYELADPIETDINEDMTYLPQLGGTEEVSPISAEFKAEIRYARKINE